MRRLVLPLVLVGAVLPGAATLPRGLAQETAEELRSPVAVFASAKKGDFETIVARFSSANAPDEGKKMTIVYRIADVASETVSLQVEPSDLPKSHLPPPFSFDRAKGPDLVALLGGRNLENVTDLATTDEKKTVAGREFACKKVTFKTKKEFDLTSRGAGSGVYSHKWTVWLSAEVKGAGIVAVDDEGEVRGKGVAEDERSLRFEVVGFGTDDKAEWGKLASEVDFSKEVEPAPARIPLPFNPFETAKVGDWQALVQTVRQKGVKEEYKLVLTNRVSKVTDDSIEFDYEMRVGDQKKPDKAKYPRKEMPALEDVGNLRPGEAKDLKVEDAKVTLGDKTFDCKKLSYNVRRVFAQGGRKVVNRMEIALFVSPAMPARGVVRLEMKSVQSGATPEPEEGSMTLEVVGYGHEDKVEWGKRGEDVDLSPKK
jgi:hypothetical protein